MRMGKNRAQKRCRALISRKTQPKPIQVGKENGHSVWQRRLRRLWGGELAVAPGRRVFEASSATSQRSRGGMPTLSDSNQRTGRGPPDGRELKGTQRDVNL